MCKQKHFNTSARRTDGTFKKRGVNLKFINFNEHIVKQKLNIYRGSEKKRTVILDDKCQYLLKFPDPTREKHREVSYINNSISEYIGCSVFALSGFEVQDTILGVYTDENGKEKIACACKDVRENGEVLYEADLLVLEFLDQNQKLTLELVEEIVSNIDGLDKEKTIKEYYDRFIIDFLIGNTDRHTGNWGIIENNNTRRIAPVYDCGSSLSPLISDQEIEKLNINNEALNVQTVFLDNEGKRTSYKKIITEDEHPRVVSALARTIHKIDLDAINSMIDEIPYISVTRKTFYKDIIAIRYNKVLIPTLEKLAGIEKSFEYKEQDSNIITYIYNKYIRPLNEANEKTGKIKIGNKDFDFVKVNNKIFIVDKKSSIGVIYLEKTNLNVCKFVQLARNLGQSVNIEDIRKITKEKTTLKK